MVFRHPQVGELDYCFSGFRTERHFRIQSLQESDLDLFDVHYMNRKEPRNILKCKSCFCI